MPVEAWKVLSQCALAGLKAQKNLSERRYRALRRKNRVLAGEQFAGCTALPHSR